ncbi:mRNA triphosphatase CET1 [Backusella circina FSU 941]|nr:mRNA triphosphatase CET1 [Backusella circina FSU 941]
MSSQKRGADEADLSNHAPVVKKPLLAREPSIFNIKPADDIVKYLANFLGSHCKLENVEIEAKLGILIDKQTGKRMDIGAFTETIISRQDNRYYRFESNMSLEQHRHYNKMLNELVEKTNAPDYRGERIRYKHTNETDRFYEDSKTRKKCRVTVDQKTGQVVPNGIIEKTRVIDLNIHSPMQALDYRISVNLENPRPKPTTPATYERNKDRISYQHGGISFDLTQVKTAAGKEGELSHELELEFADVKALANEKDKYDNKQHSQYTQMIEVFVNNIRLLSRNTLRHQ